MTPVSNVYKDIAILKLNNESDTTGNLLVKAICELYPDISAVTYNVNDITKELTLRLRTNNDPKKIIEHAIDYNIKIINNIKQSSLTNT